MPPEVEPIAVTALVGLSRAGARPAQTDSGTSAVRGAAFGARRQDPPGPAPGWTYTVTRAKLATPLTDDDGNQVTDYPSIVDWKATAGGIKPGEFSEFQLSVGPLPKADAMTFKALQSYSDGSVVSWIEIPAAGSADEPEHPAPTLKLTAAGATTATPAVTTTAAGNDDDDASKGSVTGAYVVGGIGLLAGLAALGLAVTGRKRRTTAEESRESVSV